MKNGGFARPAYISESTFWTFAPQNGHFAWLNCEHHHFWAHLRNAKYFETKHTHKSINHTHSKPKTELVQKQLSCTLALLGLKTLLTFLVKLFMHAASEPASEKKHPSISLRTTTYKRWWCFVVLTLAVGSTMHSGKWCAIQLSDMIF